MKHCASILQIAVRLSYQSMLALVIKTIPRDENNYEFSDAPST
jgi:hypothetical protein